MAATRRRKKLLGEMFSSLPLLCPSAVFFSLCRCESASGRSRLDLIRIQIAQTMHLELSPGCIQAIVGSAVTPDADALEMVDDELPC